MWEPGTSATPSRSWILAAWTATLSNGRAYRRTFIERIYGDGGYEGPKAAKTAAKTGYWTIEIVERAPAPGTRFERYAGTVGLHSSRHVRIMLSPCPHHAEAPHCTIRRQPVPVTLVGMSAAPTRLPVLPPFPKSPFYTFPRLPGPLSVGSFNRPPARWTMWAADATYVEPG
jgi:hypothetical protein